MARETQLPQGQLNPAARPVDAFIRPTDFQVAQPARPAEIGAVRGVNAIGTGGTPNVQGANSFADLAEALRPFSRALVETAQSAGVQFAKWQMDQGEAEFMAAYRKAQVTLDESTEVGETQYAQGTRAVGAKDPQAGALMWGLNPYREIGAQRGRSRIAGQEIAFGMSSYVNSQSDRIDYESPDQGFAALNKIRAEFISQVTEKHGIDENTPGFQKYTAPEIEKASEREAQRLQEDRVKYFDEMRPRQLAQLLRNEMEVQAQAGTFEYKGKTFTRAVDGDEMYYLALGNKLNDMSRDFLSKAGPGGMGGKWAREAYEILSAEANYGDNQNLRYLLSTIKSTEPLRGADGKPVIGPNGTPVYLTWNQLYSQDAIDSQIKYEQAGFASRAARTKDFGARAEAAIGGAIQGMPPGPGRAMAAAQALDRFYQEETARTGKPPSPLEMQEARRSFKEASELTNDLVFEQDDPNLPLRYMSSLNQKHGSDFNAKSEREKIDAVAAMIKDPAKQEAFFREANAAVTRREKEVQDFSGYTTPRDKVINDNISSRLLRNYPTSSNANRGKADREESERRQRTAYTEHVNNRIREEEARLKRKLSEGEVRGVTQRAIDEYGKSDKDALQYLFPGSQAYPDSPSVDPRATIKPVELGPDGKPKTNAPSPAKVYEINQLDDIPNRAVELRQFRTKPVMALNSIRSVMFDAIAGKSTNMKFERAWRDAGAPNAWDFLQKQLDFYPNYKGGDWTPEQEKKARQRLLSMAGTANAEVAKANLRQTYPSLGSLALGTIDMVLGTAPANASTFSARFNGGGSQESSTPFTASRGGSFTPEVSRFREAIFAKESGGNYSAVNPDSGALGVGQVMPYNVGPWTEKYLGRRLTPQQFLRDRAAQDAVVNGRFKDMLEDQRRAGHSGEVAIRRAAAVWYSGQAGLWNNTRPQYSNGRRYPSIAEYTQAIWDKYRRSGGYGPQSSAGSEGGFDSSSVAKLAKDLGNTASTTSGSYEQRKVQELINESQREVWAELDKKRKKEMEDLRNLPPVQANPTFDELFGRPRPN